MTYRYLKNDGDSAFEDLLRIYREAFAWESREPDERLVTELKGEYRLPFRFLVASDADQTLGFARFCRVPGADFGFLIHIAVDTSARRGGVGSSLLKQVIQALDPLPVLVEIDRCGRTRDWYDRHGFVSLTESYQQPALHPETSAVPFALCSSQPVPSAERVVREFYERVWERELPDPLVAEAMKGVRS